MIIKDIYYSYDKKTDQLKSVNSEIYAGKITTIIGPNGSGKSTLLGIMSRNHAPRSGEVTLGGKPINGYKAKEFAKKLAVVHQHNEAPADLTVEQIARFGRLPHKSLFAHSAEDDNAVEWALSCTNLQDKRHVTIDRLSGGERQKVWIAMAVAQSTPILFLDKPTTYLDIYSQFEILELIKSLNATHGLTIVMVLHDINQAIRYSDRIMVMKNGKIVMEGPPGDVITEETIKTIYGVHAIVKQSEETGLYIVPVGI